MQQTYASSHSFSTPNNSNGSGIGQQNINYYMNNNNNGAHQQQSSGGIHHQNFHQQQFNNNFPQQEQQQHTFRQSNPVITPTQYQQPLYNSHNPSNMNTYPSNNFNNTSPQRLQNNQSSNNMLFNSNTNNIGTGNIYGIHSVTTSTTFNNSHFSSRNNTFSDFYSAKSSPSTNHSEKVHNTNHHSITTSGISDYQNLYGQSTNNNRNETLSNIQPTRNTYEKTNQIYNDLNTITNQLQSSPPTTHSPNFHSSSSSDKNSNAVIEPPPPKPKQKTKSKPNPAVGQLSFTIPTISEERFDDVSEAVAFSGAKLFPIACVACRQRHKRCDRTIPTCSSCSSKGIECQYRTPRKKGRALQSNDGFQTLTSLDEIKYIPQGQGFADNETVMNSVMPSNSLYGSPPKDLGIDDIVSKKRKKPLKNDESVSKKLAVEKPVQPVENIPPINNSFNSPPILNFQSTKQDNISNKIQTPSISPSEPYDPPQTQPSTAQNMFLDNQNNLNNFSLMASNQPDMTPFSDPSSSVDTISQLLVLLLSSKNQTYVTNLVKELMSSGDGEGLKKFLSASFGLESYITTNERLNISAIKKRTVVLYDEIISCGYPILSSEYIEEALTATNIRAYSSENLALIYAIHAVTCQRLCELEQAKQAYHKSLIELKEITGKHNLIAIATYCNLALYCGGTGDIDTAQQLLASAEVYLLNRRKAKLQTNDTNLALNFIGSNGTSFTLFDNLSEDEFRVEKLKGVCSAAAFLGSGSPKPSVYFILRGYSFAEEIGSFLSECLLIFEGKVSRKDLEILTKPINATTFSDYLGVLSRVESAYSVHESARQYSSLQMRLAASLLLCVLGGARSWILHRAGIKGPIIEEYASQVTNLTTTQGFLLLHSVTIQFVAKALEIHYETICDAEQGARKNTDLLELYQLLLTCFNSLVELSKRFTRILRYYPNLLRNTAIKLMSRGFSSDAISNVLTNLTNSNAIYTVNDKEGQENEVKFNFDRLLSNFVATHVKSQPFI